MPPPVDVAGSRVLVIGGSGVLGGAIACELRKRRAKVMLAGRDAARLHERATQLGPETNSVVFDLTGDGHIGHVIDTAVATMGGLDGLVNAAGVVAFGPLIELESAALDRMVATNLVGPLETIRAALPHLEGGFVVNISGLVAETPLAGMAAYSAVKAGLSGATLALGRELRPLGIHVLDARPPHTETGLAGRSISGIAPTLPKGLDPEHVAAVIVSGLVAGKRELPAAAFRTIT